MIYGTYCKSFWQTYMNRETILYTWLFSLRDIYALQHLRTVSPRIELAKAPLRFSLYIIMTSRNIIETVDRPVIISYLFNHLSTKVKKIFWFTMDVFLFCSRFFFSFKLCIMEKNRYVFFPEKIDWNITGNNSWNKTN